MAGWAKSNWTLLAALLLIVAAGAFITYRASQPEAGVGKLEAFYYAPATDEVFVGAFAYPPVESPDGHDAVGVRYYTCGEETREEAFVGYYFRYTPEGKRRMEDPQGIKNKMVRKGRVMAEGGFEVSTDAENWTRISSSQQFSTWRASHLKKCPDGSMPDPVPPEDMKGW